jgi:hypothetical protein
VVVVEEKGGIRAVGGGVGNGGTDTGLALVPAGSSSGNNAEIPHFFAFRLSTMVIWCTIHRHRSVRSVQINP